jgi:hypothetical protein
MCVLDMGVTSCVWRFLEIWFCLPLLLPLLPLLLLLLVTSAGSGLATNIRDFFSLGKGAKANKRTEQDLKGFGQGQGACELGDSSQQPWSSCMRQQQQVRSRLQRRGGI